MERMNQKINQGLPPWPKKSLAVRPFTLMPPSTLPLAPSSFQVWKKPYYMNYGLVGASSSGTKTALQPSDAGITNLSTVGNDNIKKTQNPSPPSDKNPSSNGGVTSGAGDDSSVKTETVNGVQIGVGGNIDPNMDTRKLKRIISNRVSAQKSRMKKLQYVTDMEKKAKSLEAQIAMLSPQVTLYKSQQRVLQAEQKRLNQQMIGFINDKIVRDAEIEENKAEVDRLRQLHLAQQQQIMQNQARISGWQNGLTEQIPNHDLIQSVPGQMVYMNSNQVQIGENTGEMDNLNQLNLKQQQQQKPGQVLMPGWEPGLRQMPNPSMNQPVAQHKVNMNSNLGGIEQILNHNPVNQNQRNCFM